MKLSATYKGLITGAVIIGLSVAIYYFKGSFDNNLQYITYTVYVAGIIWALVDYSKSATGEKTFKNLFTQGFKCFIVVTLLMVVYTWVFLKMHPAMKEEMAVKYRSEMEKTGNYTAAEIDKQVALAKQYFVTALLSAAIFGYLLIGSCVTAIGSLFLKKSASQNNPI